jgi:hypothetical protein
MTIDQAHTAYNAQIDLPHGAIYAAAVRRFQRNFMSERVCRDLDEAFARAVDACERLIPVFRLQAATAAA